MSRNNYSSGMPESFRAARKNFSSNLKNILAHLNYTPTTLSLKLNAVCDSSPVSTSDIHAWLSGNKMPNVYQLYKLSYWLNVPMGSVFSSNLDLTTVHGRSFANQEIKYFVDSEVASDSEITDDDDQDEPTIINIVAPINTVTAINNTFSEENVTMTTMSSKNNNAVISRSNKSMERMKAVVAEHTSSNNYNILLVNKLYNSGYMLKDIAKAVGISTRSLRDYAFYGTTVPSDIAKNLVKVFKTTYTNLGLTYNADLDRFTHVTVTTKK